MSYLFYYYPWLLLSSFSSRRFAPSRVLRPEAARHQRPLLSLSVPALALVATALSSYMLLVVLLPSSTSPAGAGSRQPSFSRVGTAQRRRPCLARVWAVSDGGGHAWPCSHGALARRRRRLFLPAHGPRPAAAASPMTGGGGGCAHALDFLYSDLEERLSQSWQPRCRLLLCQHRHGRAVLMLGAGFLDSDLEERPPQLRASASSAPPNAAAADLIFFCFLRRL